jgi:outer membrane receptor protein involved in Fe transport
MRQVLTFVFLFFALIAQAQHKISGVLNDPEGNPVPFAQIAAYNGEEPAASATTAQDGSFTLNLENGSFTIKIFTLAFQKKSISISINGSDQDLGSIALEEKSTKLEEVVIEAEREKAPVESTMEGVVIRPDRLLSNDGGSILDILRNTPSITVSDDGSVSIRGSDGTNVLIDGRNSALAGDLAQIPASAVEKIKIINNPNSKYDAEAAGGVIDIELKKGKGKGTRTNVGLTYGTRNRTQVNARVNHRSDKFNIYGGYNFRYWPNVRNRESYREEFDNNEILVQNGNNLREPINHTFNYGGDYYFGKNKLSYEGSFLLRDRPENQSTRVRATDATSGAENFQYTRLGETTEQGTTMDNAIIYQRMFDDTTRSFKAFVSHSIRQSDEEQGIDAYFGTYDTEVSSSPTGRELFTNDRRNVRAVAQADYEQDAWKGKIETGVKFNYRQFGDDYVYKVGVGDGELVEQDNVSNHFIYDEKISAAYFLYSRKLNDFSFTVGTRIENSVIDTEQKKTGETNRQNYTNLFPSVQALYEFNDKHAIKFTYSRRIDRPGGWRLNPFPNVTDSLNQRWGNPFLRPEYINSFELGHIMTYSKFATTTNFFYRRNDGFIDFLVNIEDGVSVIQPQNLNYGETFGVEVIQTAEITDWWSLNGSFSLFVQNVDGTNLDADYTNSGLTWNAKFTTDFDLPMDFDLQFTGNYTAPEIEAQGQDFARYYVDGTIQRKFMEDRLTASLIFRDMFDIREFRGENSTSEFYQRFRFKRETQILLLSLKYRID